MSLRQGPQFPQWLTLNCGTDIGMAVTQNSVLDNASAIPSMLHTMKFQVSSVCRAHPVDKLPLSGVSSIWRTWAH